MSDILSIFLIIKSSLFLLIILAAILIRNDHKLSHQREVQFLLTLTLVLLEVFSCLDTEWIVQTSGLVNSVSPHDLKISSNDWISYYPTNGIRLFIVLFLLISYKTLSFKKAVNNSIKGADPLYFRLIIATAIIGAIIELITLLLAQNTGILLFTISIIIEILSFLVLYTTTGTLSIERIKAKSQYFYSSIFTYFLFVIALANMIILENAYPVTLILAMFAFCLKMYTIPFSSTVKSLYQTVRIETLGFLSIVTILSAWLFCIFLNTIEYYTVILPNAPYIRIFLFLIAIMTLVYFYRELKNQTTLADMSALSSILNGAVLIFAAAISGDLSWFPSIFSYLIIYSISLYILMTLITLSMGYKTYDNRFSPTYQDIRDHFAVQYPSFKILVTMVLAVLFLLPPILILKTDFITSVQLHLLDAIVCTNSPFDTFLLLGRVIILIILTISNTLLYAKLITALTFNTIQNIKKFLKKREARLKREQKKRDRLQKQKEKSIKSEKK